jgi:hypothetical protein
MSLLTNNHRCLQLRRRPNALPPPDQHRRRQTHPDQTAQEPERRVCGSHSRGVHGGTAADLGGVERHFRSHARERAGNRRVRRMFLENGEEGACELPCFAIASCSFNVWGYSEDDLDYPLWLSMFFDRVFFSFLVLQSLGFLIPHTSACYGLADWMSKARQGQAERLGSD